jgi:hypothetical protein
MKETFLPEFEIKDRERNARLLLLYGIFHSSTEFMTVRNGGTRVVPVNPNNDV